jgi:hypothetical protein
MGCLPAGRQGLLNSGQNPELSVAREDAMKNQSRKLKTKNFKP